MSFIGPSTIVLNSLIGPQGEIGTSGPTGAPGPQGPPGVVFPKDKFFKFDHTNSLGNYRTRSIGATGNFNLTFYIPIDFSSIVAISLVGIISSGAAGPNKDIDFTLSYGLVGQSSTANTAINTTSLYDFTGAANQIQAINISSLFTSITPENFCGLNIDHKGIGGPIDYLGIRLTYN